MIPQTIIHLLSGGLDSVTLLYDLVNQGENVHCVLVDYKQRHAQELVFAKAHCRSLAVLYTTVELPILLGSKLTDGKGSWVVPNRNMILISIAVNIAVSAKANMVTYACNKDDAGQFPDCRWAFVNGINASLVAAEIPVEVCVPYIGLTKRQIVGRAKELGVPLHDTWSCYKGGERPCGECPSCLKLQAALA